MAPQEGAGKYSHMGWGWPPSRAPGEASKHIHTYTCIRICHGSRAKRFGFESATEGKASPALLPPPVMRGVLDFYDVPGPWLKTIDSDFKSWLFGKTGCSARWGNRDRKKEQADKHLIISGPVEKWPEARQLATATRSAHFFPRQCWRVCLCCASCSSSRQKRGGTTPPEYRDA